ncbi:MAG: 1-acyl-sn-glycerol-3-phosphate acyltransferase, partial [Myxococcaceae bacterium]|nr:1-acyl-sn-glycerol-3-phosphate acyltransferase [Myxococcaceae bacterium]
KTRPAPVPKKGSRPTKAKSARAAKGRKPGVAAQVTAPIPVAHEDSPVGLRPPLSAPGPHVNSPDGQGLEGPIAHANSPIGLRAPASAPGPHVNSPVGLGLEGPVPHPNSPIGIPQGSAPRPHPNSPIGIPQGSAPRPHPNSPIGIPQGSAPRPHPNSPIGIPQGSAPRPHPNSPIGIPRGSAPRPHPNSPEAVSPPSAPRPHLSSPEGLGLEGVISHPNSPEGLAREPRPSAERVRERLNLATASIPPRATPAPPSHELHPPRASPAPLVPGHEPRLSASTGGWRGALEGLAHAARVGLGLGGGDQVDVWGKDPALEARLRPLGDFLLERYWRLDLEGAHHLPQGPCLVIANHSGALPLDGPVLASALRRARPELQAPRWLVEDQVFDAPVVGLMLARLGAIRANPDNAIRLLRERRPVLVFPEGIHGLSKPFQQRYQLQRFGRGGFVKLAVRERVPIIPAAIVGAEESMPLLGRLPGGWLGLPHLPVTTPPLPARWKIALGPAIDLSDAPSQAPEGDLAWVQRANDRTRSTIEGLIQQLLRARPGVF